MDKQLELIGNSTVRCPQVQGVPCGQVTDHAELDKENVLHQIKCVLGWLILHLQFHSHIWLWRFPTQTSPPSQTGTRFP